MDFMDRKQALQKIAAEIKRCPLCKKGGTGKAVPGEGSPDAAIVLVGEAPGREESKIGRPFVGRSGRLLRQVLKETGIAEDEAFITSPGHYLPLRGTPSPEMIRHGRTHLLQQLAVIDPEIIVLMGKTACLALLDRAVEVSKEHGAVVHKDGRTHLITLHPAYAMRFPEGRKQFIADFRKLRGIVARRARTS